MKKATPKETRIWLLVLMARLPSNVVGDEREAEAKVQLMAPGLSQSYPQAAFTEASANYVMIDLEWFREADIRVRLDRWRKIYLPDFSTLPDIAAKAPLDEDGKNWIARWLRSQTPATLGLIRSYHMPAYVWLMRTDVEAASIAVRQGWPDPNDTAPRNLEAEWGDPHTVERALRSCYGHHNDGRDSNPTPAQITESLRTLSWLVEKFAPHNLPMVEAAWER